MILPDEEATSLLGGRLAPCLRAGDIIALKGELGAGKTTLARGLLAGLGLAEEAPSPTFAIVQPYEPPDVRLPIAHVDLYRLDTPEEVEELGLDDLLAAGALLIEWPERMGDRLWPEALIIALAVLPGGGRALTATVPAAWEARWPPA